MCLIIFTPNIKSATIRKSVLERGFNRNDDGAGFAYVKDGELIISKAYMDFDTFHLAYQQMRSAVNKGPLLIHFRHATCGPNNVTNTQPLNIYTGKLVMAHNGVFGHLSDHDSELSDSVVLSRMIRRQGLTFPFKKAYVEMLDALCDKSSKLVFLDNKNHYTIINEGLGKWKRGCWYSDGANVCDSTSIRYAKPVIREYWNDDDDYRDKYQPFAPHRSRIRKHFGATVVTQSGSVVKSIPMERPNIPSGMPRHMMNTDERIQHDKWVSYQKRVFGLDEHGNKISKDQNDFTKHSLPSFYADEDFGRISSRMH